MKNLLNIESIVTEELKGNYLARKSDKVLILGVLKRIGVDQNTPIAELFKNKEIPNFKSIYRARRKVQSKYPELKDCETALWREELEELYKEYAHCAEF